MDRFTYLSQGLSAILAFIGVKMLLIDVWHPPLWLSLAVIVGVLTLTALLSLRVPPPQPETDEGWPDVEGPEPLDGSERHPESREAEPVGAGRG